MQQYFVVYILAIQIFADIDWNSHPGCPVSDVFVGIKARTEPVLKKCFNSVS
jgi:hypothetical protein